MIIARKYDSKNTNYNQLKGSGIYPRGPICTLEKCLPKSKPAPKKPVPKTLNKSAPDPLIATKQSPKDNKWTLNGVRYPDFNSFWVNIPRKSFTILRTNG